jgi:serine/threonine protein phosphatase PrpC
MTWIGIGALVIVLIGVLVLTRRSPEPSPSAKPEHKPASKSDDDDDPIEITLVRAVPLELVQSVSKPAALVDVPAAPASEDEEEGGEEEAPARTSTTTPFYPDDEPDASVDEPTQPATRFLMSACGQTDRGLARRRNEDSYLVVDDQGIFVVADGMGGYAGGKVASELAVATLREIFDKEEFSEPLDVGVPRRGAEIAWAVQKANGAIFARASVEPELAQMGTTIVAARFSPNKQRAYIAHVGDSRAYRFRDGRLRRLTTDHTMKQLGFKGKGSEHLYRAVGIAPTVDVDLIIDKPRPDDLYLFCSDGLTKMASDADIATVIDDNVDDPEAAVYSLIEIANDGGGKDNVTCIVVKVVETVLPLVKSQLHTVEV